MIPGSVRKSHLKRNLRSGAITNTSSGATMLEKQPRNTLTSRWLSTRVAAIPKARRSCSAPSRTTRRSPRSTWARPSYSATAPSWPSPSNPFAPGCPKIQRFQASTINWWGLCIGENNKLICNDLLSRPNCKKSQQNFILLFLKTSGKSLGVSVPGIGHSDIRGLVTDRSMVRREPYRLETWITNFFVPT